MKAFSSALLAALTITVVSCGGSGGAPRIKGNFCPNGYDPVPVEKMDANIAKKVTEKPEERFTKLPAGKYSYEGADFLYKKLTDLPYKDHPKYTTIHIKDTLDTVRGFQMLNQCVSHVDRNTKISHAETEITGITEMEIAANGDATYKTKTFRFSLETGKLQRESDDPVQQKGSPADFYKLPEAQFEIYQHVSDGNVYEIRFREDVDKNTSLFLAIKLRRSDLK